MTDRTGLLRNSLLAKSLLVVCAASVLVVVAFIFTTLQLTRQRAVTQATERLEQLIESTSVMAGIACFADDATLAKETAQGFVKHNDVLSVIIRSSKRELARAVRSGADVAVSNSQALGILTRNVYSPFDVDSPAGEIVVFPNWKEINREVSEDVRHSAFILILFALAIVGVIASVVLLFVIRPVKRISDRLHAMDAATGEMLAIPPGHASNELGRLVGDINDLIVRFRVSLQQEHKLHLERVVSENMRLSSEVFEHSHEGIIITDRNNEILTVNRAFTAITGYTSDEVAGKNPRVFSSGRHDRDFYAAMWKSLLGQGLWRGELWNRRKTGEIVPNWFSINTVKNELGEIINHIAIFSDITERKRAEERIDFLAHHDPLTKLPNRVLLRDRFNQACASALRNHSGVSVLFVDLDNFKHINDSFGHQAGDRVLVSVVGRLQGFIRDSDTICRQGGDEFIVVLHNLHDVNVITRITQNMLDALSAPVEVENFSISLSASVGIAIFPNDGRAFDDLLKNADAAMYEAKASGKNTFRFFTESMNKGALDKLQMKAHLRTALSNHEFSLHYQPQINLETGRIIGVESLIRWHHPELGTISPALFIPLAEESGLIAPIGEWVLREACRQGRQWIDSGMDALVVSVNISALQFKRGNVFELVRDVLLDTGYPADLLELEFTESALLNNVEETRETIRNLKAFGVKLAIDDFGTGYSSLSYLKQIKVDKLKIDQSFVRDIGHDMDDLAIVSAIIQLGKTLQLRVIAEGVEMAEQLHILERLGCDEVQGYYFARPQPAGEVTALIRGWMPNLSDTGLKKRAAPAIALS